MASPTVPKLNLAPLKFSRLESLDETMVRHDKTVVQTERAGNDNNPRTKKKKKKMIKRLSRRDSMMELLREDLKNIDPLPVLKTYRPPSVNDIPTANLDLVDGDLSPFHAMANDVKNELSKRRKSSISGQYFRSRKLSSVSSDGDVIVDGYELKKIRMIESLTNMGYELPKTRNRLFSSDEREILDQLSFARKNSLSTRLLHAIPDKRKRSRSRSVERNKQPTPTSRPVTNEEAKEKIQKMLNIMSKPTTTDTSPFPGLSNKPRGTLTSSDYASETLGTFRRKIRRRKVKDFQRVFVYLELYKSK